MLERTTFFPLLNHDTRQFTGSSTCSMSSHIRRRSSLAQTSFEATLRTEPSGEPADLPTPHIGPTTPTESSMPPPPVYAIAHHSRTSSEHSRKPNRLSLSFPVAPSPTLDSPRPTPTSSNITSFPPTPSDVITASASDPAALLVAVASQERRVLEIREELAKAEGDLNQLKKQWQIHEATRKRAEIRNTAQLQPLSSVVTDGRSSLDDPSTRQSLDLDRKKALLANVPKDRKRKVFSGGHARTLSLLSPERQTFNPANASFTADKQQTGSPQETTISETTIPDTSQGISKISSSRASARHTYQGGVSYSAKQIADGMRSGLWTFIEDLRQATVGDEGVTGPKKRPSIDSLKKVPSRKGSKGSLRGRRGHSPRHSPSSRNRESLRSVNNVHIDATGSIWPNERRDSSKSPAGLTVKPISLAPPDDDDGWSNWDSPESKSPIRWSGSSLSERDPTTPSHKAGDAYPVKYVDTNRDANRQADKLQNP